VVWCGVVWCGVGDDGDDGVGYDVGDDGVGDDVGDDGVGDVKNDQKEDTFAQFKDFG
jgi:hypothetical protein